MKKSNSSLSAAWLSLAALVLANSAQAASPYNLPYGVQWSFIIGNSSSDVPNTLAVSPDGTVWISTGGTAQSLTNPMLTWGSNKTLYGGPSASGYGQINRLGGILQCNDIPNVTGLSTKGQILSPTIAFSGNNPTAYFGCAPNYLLTWTDANPADTTSGKAQPMTFAIPSALGQTGFEPFGDFLNASGDPLSTTLPRKNDPLDPTKKFTHAMVSVDSYGGSVFDFKVGSDGSYYIARQAQAGSDAAGPLAKGDSFTSGDFSGPINASYKPVVGKVSADGLTLSGPAHQPECGGRSFFTDIAINESANAGAGKVYVAGMGRTQSGGTMNYLDPDGPGTDFASIPFNPATPNNFKGFAMVYNATTWAIDKVVTWESNQGGDIPGDITATADGGFVLVGQTLGSLGGFTNPAEGTNDGYIEVYDASGTLAWKFQTETSVADSFGDASVDADGNIYVSGNSNGNPTLWKFTASGSLVWASPIDNAGTVESQSDHGGDKNSFFYLSSHNRTAGTGTWPNTITYVPQGTDENLLQKLSPGDFDANKWVDFADVQIAGTATKPGLTGVDTYDFNGDGDSTLADTTYMITHIMDRFVGDIAQDRLVSDVDNADIGRAIGASGTGTLYLDGDLDWDADVDNSDIAAVAAAFTGAKSLGAWTHGSPGATLRYRASDGRVWLHADEASGGVITSFQLENAEGTFVTPDYTGPSTGSFGGSLKDVTTHVIGDTDLTLAGMAGIVSLGKILPSGMNLAELTAYLKTAVYSGQAGSGQKSFTLLLGTIASPYDNWEATNAPTTGNDPTADEDGDGVSNGLEFVLGGSISSNDIEKLPVPTLSANNVTFTFDRSVNSIDGSTSTVIEVGTDLAFWPDTYSVGENTATSDPGVVVAEDTSLGFDTITLTLPQAPDAKKFGRLKVIVTP